ncbi:NuoI/complex I 23 kDa subunit family protein [Micromonospora haikouensis]|uniref:NuoI/complex I 23 kDa subunit family protein n=1 Tax=Micromonospora haikouensis TaxID=686309 RepID=UPI003675B148
MGETSGRGVPGAGLAKGLAVTLRTMTRRSTTQQYPDVAPELPPRSRGVIALLAENCTVCMLCARECPDWCIYIDSHKEEVAVPGAARPRQRNVLDRFDIDFSLCMYCGICVEVCPFDALYWSPEFEYAEYDIRDLLHDKDHLGEWMATVPPPPAHDRNGEPAKEETTAARKAAAPAGSVARPTPSRVRPEPGPAARPTSAPAAPAPGPATTDGPAAPADGTPTDPGAAP